MIIRKELEKIRFFFCGIIYLRKGDTMDILEELFNTENDFKSEGIWMLSILLLALMNKSEQPIINIYLGDE